MRRAVSAGMLVLALCLPASATKLSGPEVRDMVVTGTVFLETGFGDFPLRYDQAGRVTGDGTALGLARFFAPLNGSIKPGQYVGSQKILHSGKVTGGELQQYHLV